MKIVVATTSFPSGASEALKVAGKFVLHECRAYAEAGAQVTVVTPHIPGVPKRESFGAIQVERFTYFWPESMQRVRRTDGSPIYSKMDPLVLSQLPLFFASFSKALIKHGWDADIIHCNWTLTAFLAYPLRILKSKPIVVTARGSDLRLIPKAANRWLFKRLDAILDPFGPYPNNLSLRDCIPGRYISLPQITARPATEKPAVAKYEKGKDEFLIVYVGRFVREKVDFGLGLLDLPEAIDLLKEDHPGLRVCYVGDGDYRQNLEEKVIRFGLDDRIDFAGYQSDVYRYLNDADLVMGGIGLNAVCLEATVSGKVQLMPRVSDFYENMWQDEVNALLYEPGDAEELARKIGLFIEIREKRKEMEKAVKEMGKRYVRFVDEGGCVYLEVFKEIIAKRSGEKKIRSGLSAD